DPLLTKRTFMAKRYQQTAFYAAQSSLRFSSGVTLKTVEHPHPLFRTGFRRQVTCPFPRPLAPLAYDFRIQGECFHRAIQGVHVVGDNTHSVAATLDKIESSTDRIRCNDRQACGQSLVDHDPPSVVPAGQNEDIALAKIFRQAFRGLKALITNSCPRRRAHPRHEIRQFCLPPDQQQSCVMSARDEAIERQKQQIDAFPPDHLTAKEERHRPSSPVTATDGKKSR